MVEEFPERDHLCFDLKLARDKCLVSPLAYALWVKTYSLQPAVRFVPSSEYKSLYKLYKYIIYINIISSVYKRDVGMIA